ncbi:MAG: class I SAM-dependent methyltransferase [Pseudonocardiales bacterium]|nr:class I SAM-dependent methyltransferase [Pseudonocardiales bacterium]
MNMTNRYQTVWENYWKSLSGAPGEILWDVPPEQAAALDLAVFAEYVDPSLPMIDLGCGNGTQTRFLAEHFPTVIGTEISSQALAIATETDKGSQTSYRPLDLLDRGAVGALHAEIGDANLYVRTVLHQFDPSDHAAAAGGIAELIGDHGVATVVELSSVAEPFLTELIGGSTPPPQLARILQHEITPGLLDEHDIGALFPPDDFEVLASGPTAIRTCYTAPGGDQMMVPAFFVVLCGRRPEIAASQ